MVLFSFYFQTEYVQSFLGIKFSLTKSLKKLINKILFFKKEGRKEKQTLCKSLIWKYLKMTPKFVRGTVIFEPILCPQLSIIVSQVVRAGIWESHEA